MNLLVQDILIHLIAQHFRLYHKFVAVKFRISRLWFCLFYLTDTFQLLNLLVQCILVIRYIYLDICTGRFKKGLWPEKCILTLQRFLDTVILLICEGNVAAGNRLFDSVLLFYRQSVSGISLISVP